MKRRIIVCVLLLVVASWLQAQPRIAFDKTDCDLGEIIWKKPVTVTYTIINKGSKPLTVDSVKTSCGCMDAMWTQKSIPSKGFGTISVIYDAKMLGHFQRYVIVHSNGSDTPAFLTMSGAVRTEITDYSKEYPVQIGNLYLEKNAVEFPDVSRGDKPMAEIAVVNGSEQPYTPVLMHLPSYMEAKSEPEVLAPRQHGKIVLTLHSDALPDLGLTRISVYLARFLGDTVSEENEISVMAVLLPDFSKLTAAQRTLAPKVMLSASQLELQLGTKKKVWGILTLANGGRSTLEILDLHVTDPAINVSLKKRTLAPGESMKIKVTAVAEYAKKRGHTPRIMIIANDPIQPKNEIKVHIKK